MGKDTALVLLILKRNKESLLVIRAFYEVFNKAM